MLIRLLILLVATVPAVAQTRVDAIAASVDQHYNKMKSLKADFVHTYHSGDIERSESGTLWLKKPGKMRWDYTSPRSKLFLTDGKTAWFYVPGERQARRAPLKKIDDLRSPLRYMLGHTQLNREFNALSLAPDVKPSAPGNAVLRGVPRGMEDRVSQVILEVNTAYEIVRLTIFEQDGSVTEFRFLNQSENLAITDDRFRFTPPKGVEMVETAEVAP